MVVRGWGQVLFGKTHWTAAVADVVEVVVLQRVMQLVVDYWPGVVLWGRKNTRLLVQVWVRRVGLGWRPQQGRGRDRGRRLLLLLDTERRRGGEA